MKTKYALKSFIHFYGKYNEHTSSLIKELHLFKIKEISILNTNIFQVCILEKVGLKQQWEKRKLLM